MGDVSGSNLGSTSASNLLSSLQQFKSFPRSNNDIIFLGNSITHWVDWNELLQMKEIKNRGIPGDITFGVLERVNETIAGNPVKIFVLIGINDIARNVPDTVILVNYKRIIRGIKAGSPSTKIYFQPIFFHNWLDDSVNHYKLVQGNCSTSYYEFC